MAQRGAQFPGWVLDQLHIEVMLANRVAMGAGLTPPQFRWVSFADPLMLPLDTRGEAARTPDTGPLYPLEGKLVRRYLRDLDFDAPDSPAAAAIYARCVGGGVPSRPDYKLLEDHLVRVIAREAGRLGVAVQIHATDGFGGFYSAAGAAPHLLESLFNDPALRVTHFIIVHGGWPLVQETMSQLAKPNVYADISMMDQLAEPTALSRTLRLWLAAWPDKVLFGTDAFDGGVQQGWEQVAWVASHNARRALNAALAGMVRDREITLERAQQLARMVLRENAMAAYNLKERSQE